MIEPHCARCGTGPPRRGAALSPFKDQAGTAIKADRRAKAAGLAGLNGTLAGGGDWRSGRPGGFAFWRRRKLCGCFHFARWLARFDDHGGKRGAR